MQHKSVIPENQPHKENGEENEKNTRGKTFCPSILHMLCKFQKDRSRNKKVEKKRDGPLKKQHTDYRVAN